MNSNMVGKIWVGMSSIHWYSFNPIQNLKSLVKTLTLNAGIFDIY